LETEKYTKYYPYILVCFRKRKDVDLVIFVKATKMGVVAQQSLEYGLQHWICHKMFKTGMAVRKESLKYGA
jgi:hypothetical protein